MHHLHHQNGLAVHNAPNRSTLEGILMVHRPEGENPGGSRRFDPAGSEVSDSPWSWQSTRAAYPRPYSAAMVAIPAESLREFLPFREVFFYPREVLNPVLKPRDITKPRPRNPTHIMSGQGSGT